MNIKGYPNYVVTADGNVFSNTSNRFLVKSIGSNGYLTVTLCNEGLRKTHTVHRLVAEAYLEKQKGKDYINHQNGDKRDNRVENLEWCTQQENILHSLETGLANTAKGSSVSGSKLVEEDIPKIKKLIFLGLSDSEIGVSFNVHRRTINDVRRGITWKHIT